MIVLLEAAQRKREAIEYDVLSVTLAFQEVRAPDKASDEPGSWLVVNRVGCVYLFDATLVHHSYTV